ncbi:hypothetical protein [Halioxenophilus sp. WMMB6]|uniref:hypothetical protein n=1 Tax=Halioxenophilus sp. WMMB6 TaxID=3073815 RepID=UPI00295F482A|nr:hypothetical protein [Halioxenophilus sp. WMMB6]
MKRLFAALLLTTIGIASVQAEEPRPEPVGVLETNSHRVIIHLGGSKPLYTVYDLDGNLLADLLDHDQLITQMPELEGIFHKGVAKDASLEKGGSAPSDKPFE